MIPFAGIHGSRRYRDPRRDFFSSLQQRWKWQTDFFHGCNSGGNRKQNFFTVATAVEMANKIF
jgi:hypothetical protein